MHIDEELFKQARFKNKLKQYEQAKSERKTVFMDSSGIGLVMGRFREMELIGGKVRAVHVGERMRRILVMSGVTRVIEVEEEKTWK